MKSSTLVAFLCIAIINLPSFALLDTVFHTVSAWQYGKKNRAMMQDIIRDLLHKKYVDRTALIAAITSHQNSIPSSEQVAPLSMALNGLQVALKEFDLPIKSTQPYQSFALMKIYIIYDHFFHLDRSMQITQNRIQKNHLTKAAHAATALDMISQLYLFTEANQPITERAPEYGYLFTLSRGMMQMINPQPTTMAFAYTMQDVKIEWQADMPKEKQQKALLKAFDTYAHYFNAMFPKTPISTQLKHSFESKIKRQMGKLGGIK